MTVLELPIAKRKLDAFVNEMRAIGYDAVAAATPMRPNVDGRMDVHVSMSGGPDFHNQADCVAVLAVKLISIGFTGEEELAMAIKHHLVTHKDVT